MSGAARNRRPWRRLLRRAAPALLGLALTATLAVALQVRQVRVFGTHRFPSREVEAALRSALGTPTIATRADELRGIVRTIPWVADATVRVSLDGVITCAVSERVPVALAVDDGVRRLLDQEGHVLGPAEPGAALLELGGFGPFPEERAALLAAIAELEHRWKGRLERVDRVGPRDVALHFTGTPFPLLADPTNPAALDAAGRVLAAWVAAKRAVPLRLDARVAGRVAVLPPPPAGEVS